MTTTTATYSPETPHEADKARPALPCAQPMDSLHKTLYGAFLILAAALLVSINMLPPQGPASAPLSCTAQPTR